MSDLDLDIRFKINAQEAASQANTVKESVGKVNKAQADQEGILERLRRKLAELKEAQEKALSVTAIEKSNIKIQAFQKEIHRLSKIGVQGFDDMGRAIPDFDRPVGRINRLIEAAKLYAKASREATNPEVIEKYNKKFESTKEEIGRLSNVGKKGFDQMGNAIEGNSGKLGKVWSGLRLVANILPGIGIAGIIAFLTAPIVNYIAKLDILGSKVTLLAAKLNALNEVNREAAKDAAQQRIVLQTLYKAVTDTNEAMSIRLKAAKELQKLYPESFSASRTQALLNGQEASSYRKLTDEILENAKAKAAQNKIIELESQIIESEFQKQKIRNANANERARYQAQVGNKRFADFTASETVITNNRDLYNQQDADNDKKASDRRAKAEIDSENAKQKTLKSQQEFLTKYTSQANKIKSIVGQDAPKVDSAAINQAAALQQQVDEFLKRYSRKSLSPDQEQERAINDEFEAIAKKVENFNKNPKNKIKITTEGLGEAKQQAIDDLHYRKETETVKQNLDEQKRLYASYESYRKELGEEAANKLFAGQIDSNKTYLQRLLDLQKEFAGKNLSGVEIERKKAIDELVKQASNEDSEQQRKDFADAYNAAVTLQQKIFAIEEQYAKKRGALGASITAEQLLNLERAKNDAINAAKEEALHKTEIYKRVNTEILEQTTAQVKEQIAQYNKLLEAGLIPEDLRPKIQGALNTLEFNLKIGVDQANLNALKTRYNELISVLQSTDEQGKSVLSTDDFKRIMQQLAEIEAKIKEIDSNGDGIVTWGDKVKENFAYLKGNTKEIAQGIANDLGQLSGSFSELSNALGGNNTQAGYLLDTFGQLAKAGSDAAGAVASFASGDIVGGISKTISSIGGFLSVGKKVKEMNAAARAEAQKYYDDAKQGEIEYNALLRQRDREDAKAAAMRLKSLKEEHELLKKQQTEIDSQADSLLRQLQGLSDGQITGTKYIHGTWFRKARVEYSTASLRGASYDDLEKMYSQNKLSEGARSLFEQLKKLKDEGADVSNALKDVSQAAAEIFTGTTSDSFRSGFAQLFKDGKTSVDDFTNFFKDRMQDAALSIFENKYLAGAIDSFYEQFADAAQSGDELTQTEIDNLRKIYETMSEEAKKKFDDLKAVTGIDTGSSSSSSSSTIKGDVKNITEETAGVLSGRIAAIQVMLTQGLTLNREYYGNGLAEIRRQTLLQMEIANNTKRTADNTNRLEGMERSLDSIDKKMGNNNAALAASGIR